MNKMGRRVSSKFASAGDGELNAYFLLNILCMINTRSRMEAFRILDLISFPSIFHINDIICISQYENQCGVFGRGQRYMTESTKGNYS